MPHPTGLLTLHVLRRGALLVGVALAAAAAVSVTGSQTLVALAAGCVISGAFVAAPWAV